MAVKEELQELVKLTKESSKEKVAEQIRKVGEKGGEVIYQLIVMLIKERMDRGYSKRYSLAEIQERLPWKKSRIIDKLQKTVEEGVMKHKKRKYQLNKENELVKKIWNYYNEPRYKEKKKTEEIRKMIRKKREKELMKEEKKGKYREATKKEKEEFRREIKEYLEAGVETEEIKEFITKRKVEALGYRKREK